MDEHLNKRLFGNYEFIMQFDVIDYVNNEPMIKKLNEEKLLAISEAAECRERVGALDSHVRQLELEQTRLKGEITRLQEKLTALDRGTWILFILSLVGAIFAGIGGNLVTSDPYGWVGWLFIVAAILLEVAVFFQRPTKGSQ